MQWINNDDNEPVELNISPDKVCDVISKTRVFDVKVDPVEPEFADSSTHTDNQDVLEDYPGDPAREELRAAIDDLNDDEVVDLIALAWVGRGVHSREEWEDARALAREHHREHSADYLIGMPTLADRYAYAWRLPRGGPCSIGYSCEA